MNQTIRQEMKKIEAPTEEIRARSELGVALAKQGMKRDRKKIYGISSATVLILAIGIFIFFSGDFSPEDSYEQLTEPIMTEDGIYIPPIELPDDDPMSDSDMIGLVVYNGKSYIQTESEIDPTLAKDVLGEKLGTTKGGVDESSKQKDYEEVELASTWSGMDVYTVQGYDPSFRIMTYTEQGGEIWAEIMEHINDITIKSGADVFGSLKMLGNVAAASWQSYDDWLNSRERFYELTDLNIVEEFVVGLNEAKPLLAEDGAHPFYESKDIKKLSIALQDGIVVNLSLQKDGYVRYGYIDVIFEMDHEVFSKLWELME